MYIKKIKLENFRNYNNQEIKLCNKINNIYGSNAQGKTNILEAIFICSLGKSFRTNNDKDLINTNNNEKDYFNIEVEYKNENRIGKTKLEFKQKKEFFINDIKAKKISDILGKIYIVLFSPQDISILKNEPSKRRRFLNIMISQLRPVYVHTLNKYNKIIEQRNNYLKQIKFENKSEDILDIWDEQLANLGLKIYSYRNDFINKLNNKIKKIHFDTTKENIEIKYKTNINKNNYLEKIKNNRKNDIEKGYTTIGIHRDDFEIFIDNKNISVYGSQGQQRSSIISLKLAEAEVIYEEIEEYPIILLDDFMSELDKTRIKGFIENIKKNQVIITSTEKIKLENNTRFFNVKNAIIKEIKNNK